MALKDWKKLKYIPQELQEGDDFVTIWENKKNGIYLFIIKDDFNGYIVGKKDFSQMDNPIILHYAKTKQQALKYAKDYMRKN